METDNRGEPSPRPASVPRTGGTSLFVRTVLFKRSAWTKRAPSTPIKSRSRTLFFFSFSLFLSIEALCDKDVERCSFPYGRRVVLMERGPVSFEGNVRGRNGREETFRKRFGCSIV